MKFNLNTRLGTVDLSFDPDNTGFADLYIVHKGKQLRLSVSFREETGRICLDTKEGKKSWCFQAGFMLWKWHGQPVKKKPGGKFHDKFVQPVIEIVQTWMNENPKVVGEWKRSRMYQCN